MGACSSARKAVLIHPPIRRYNRARRADSLAFEHYPIDSLKNLTIWSLL